MSLKSTVGLDWFDLFIHLGITAMVMIVVNTASHSPDSEGATAAVVGLSLGLLAWRRKRALRQMPAVSTGEIRLERMEEMESRLAELEANQGRMLELEERLDFAERLLVRQREAPGLGAGDRA